MYLKGDGIFFKLCIKIIYTGRGLFLANAYSTWRPFNLKLNTKMRYFKFSSGMNIFSFISLDSCRCPLPLLHPPHLKLQPCNLEYTMQPQPREDTKICFSFVEPQKYGYPSPMTLGVHIFFVYLFFLLPLMKYFSSYWSRGFKHLAQLYFLCVFQLLFLKLFPQQK